MGARWRPASCTGPSALVRMPSGSGQEWMGRAPGDEIPNQSSEPTELTALISNSPTDSPTGIERFLSDDYLFGFPVGALSEIGAVAVPPPLALPASMTHFFRFDVFAPQTPLPIFVDDLELC